MTFVAIALLLAPYMAMALDNGVGITPPMGWLAWERYRCVIDCETYPDECINEKLFLDMADRLAEDGYRDAGYVYVNIDDCWAEMERENGQMVGDKTRFPSGMKAIGDYLHKRGLKFGIYSDVGTHTCAGYPGSIGYETVDAETFANWGVDSLKLDGCYASDDDYTARYPLWAKALNATGRPILYECSWPAYTGITSPFDIIAENCNYWRPYTDIDDNWEAVVSTIDWWGDNQDILNVNSHSGAFNDPDMLIIGNFGLSHEESKVQMSLWAIMMAPLFMSNDLRNVDALSREVLLNAEVIAVNQDPACIQGRRLAKSKNSIEVWTRPLHDGSLAVVVFNRDSTGSGVFVTTSLSDIGIHTQYVTARDLWTHSDLGYVTKLVTEVRPHGVVMLKVTPVPDGVANNVVVASS